MSWVNALKALFAAKKVHGVYSKLEKIGDATKRIQKKKAKDLTWDDIKIFKNKHIEKGLKEIRDEAKALKAALDAEVDWPVDESQDWLEKARKVVKANDGDVDAASTELDAHLRYLQIYEQDLERLIASLEKWKPTMNNNGRTALKISTYARDMSKTLRTCAKIPFPFSTAPQAQFVSYSQNMLTIAGEAGSLADGYKRLLRRNGEHIREAQGLLKENKVFLNWNMKREFEKDKSWL